MHIAYSTYTMSVCHTTSAKQASAPASVLHYCCELFTFQPEPEGAPHALWSNQMHTPPAEERHRSSHQKKQCCPHSGPVIPALVCAGTCAGAVPRLGMDGLIGIIFPRQSLQGGNLARVANLENAWYKFSSRRACMSLMHKCPHYA